MAITKIHPIKSTLKKAIDYIVDPAKTDDKLLVSSFGCAVETADLEFEKTRLLAMQKGNNLAHQLIQAFEPGEVSYAQAHEIGRQLADEILGGKYEYVIATVVLWGVRMTSAELKHRAELQEWATQIQECRSSGLSVSEWCRQQGVTTTLLASFSGIPLYFAEAQILPSKKTVKMLRSGLKK